MLREPGEERLRRLGGFLVALVSHQDLNELSVSLERAALVLDRLARDAQSFIDRALALEHSRQAGQCHDIGWGTCDQLFVDAHHAAEVADLEVRLLKALEHEVGAARLVGNQSHPVGDGALGVLFSDGDVTEVHVRQSGARVFLDRRL